ASAVYPYLMSVSSKPLPYCVRSSAPPEIYPLSLHDALPISRRELGRVGAVRQEALRPERVVARPEGDDRVLRQRGGELAVDGVRSEEHTSELQSREKLVCRLLLEKKKYRLDHMGRPITRHAR